MRSEALTPKAFSGTGLVSTILRQSDITVAIGVLGILFVMLVPMPAKLLDILLALNITFSIVTLLVVLYVNRPLDFSVFPSMLLIATLFRLSLNVASTRRILLFGNQSELAAGQVIRSFGKFVVGGNYVVGFVVFLILVIIQFVVITKGAGRVAEVAARFTLDAMPMKQMAIDTDLNAGVITDQEARRRREEVSNEADFYGAMDGASKFVRGDAIAGLIITAVNIIGGFLIGVIQNGMPLAEAVRRYTLLTIGDGLVSQIPALIISTSAGVLVTRAGTESDFGQSLTRQVLFKPRVLVIASGVLFALGVVPGLPKFSFFTLSAITGILAYIMNVTDVGIEPEEEEEDTRSPAEIEAQDVERMLDVEVMGLDLGFKLVPLAEGNENSKLVQKIRMIRHHFAMTMGIVIPAVRIRDDMGIPGNSYRIIIKENAVASGELMPNHFLAIETNNVTEQVDGIPGVEPTGNTPALWITPEAREKAQKAGYMVVDPITVITTHLMETIVKHAHELINRQDVRKMLDRLQQRYPSLVDDLVPSKVEIRILQKVLQNLLRERIPIRDLATILESIADHIDKTKNPMLLTEFVRIDLGRTICKSLMGDDDRLSCLALSPELERTISESIQTSDDNMYLALDPNIRTRIVNKIADAIVNLPQLETQPTIVCSEALIRPFLHQIVERFIPGLAVISYEEIPPEIEIRSLGVVSWD